MDQDIKNLITQAIIHLSKKDYERAKLLLEKAAEKGNSWAEVFLA